MKYQVGDKLVCPFHGAGVVAAIEVCEVLNQFREYYVLLFDHIRLKLNVPTDNIDQFGVRELVSKEEIPGILAHFYEVSCDNDISWNKRHREIIDKLRSGNILYEIDVYKFLRLKELSKQLSTGEKKLMIESGNAIISEIAFVTEKSFSETQKLIDDIIFEISKDGV